VDDRPERLLERLLGPATAAATLSTTGTEPL
jgi:hypothetical protein